MFVDYGYVVVVQPIGTVTFSLGPDADCFETGVLTITGTDGNVLRTFGRMHWLRATRYGADDYVRYEHRNPFAEEAERGRDLIFRLAASAGPWPPIVTCQDCGWYGEESRLKAQACPLCDGRVADQVPERKAS